MSVLTHRISPNLRWRLGLVIDVCMGAFLVIATVYGGILTAVVWKQTSASLAIRMTYVYLYVPTSCFFMLLFNMTQIVRVLKTKKPLAIWGEDWS